MVVPTLTVKPGIYFRMIPFGGKETRVVAADYVYSIKRLMDPKIASPNYYLIEEQARLGMKPVREAAGEVRQVRLRPRDSGVAGTGSLPPADRV